MNNLFSVKSILHVVKAVFARMIVAMNKEIASSRPVPEITLFFIECFII